MLGFVGAEFRRNRVVQVHRLDRIESADGMRLARILALVVVPVAGLAGRHDGIVAGFGGSDSACLAAPAHHRSVGSQSALEDFVPADDLAPAGVQVALDAADEVALQRVLVGQALSGDARLALGAFVPARFGALVAPDVDVLAGEERQDLIQNTFEKAKYRVVAGAVDVVEHAPPGGDGLLLARTAQLGIGREGRTGVARKLNFRNHRDVPRRRIGHDFAHLVLGVESAVARAVEALVAVGADLRGIAPGSDLGEARVALDFDAPSLVFGEVPVKAVHFVLGHQVEVALDEIHVKKVAADVEVHSAVGKSRLVAHGHGGQRFASVFGLNEGLDSVKNGGSGTSGDHNLALTDAQRIGFGRNALLNAQFRRHRPSLGGGLGGVPPRADEVCLALEGRRRHDVEVAGHRDGFALDLHGLRPRNHLQRLGKAHATGY